MKVTVIAPSKEIRELIKIVVEERRGRWENSGLDEICVKTSNYSLEKNVVKFTIEGIKEGKVVCIGESSPNSTNIREAIRSAIQRFESALSKFESKKKKIKREPKDFI